MANKYWVGGTGNWTDTAHWADTSGGAGGAAVPAATDTVVFDANSAAAGFTVTATGTFTIAGLDATACPYADCALVFIGSASRGVPAFKVTGDWRMPDNFKFSFGNYSVLISPPSGSTAHLAIGKLEGKTFQFDGADASSTIVLDGNLYLDNIGNPTVVPTIGFVSGAAALDTNGHDIVLSSVDEVNLTSQFLADVAGTVVHHNGGKIRAGRVQLAGSTYNSVGGYIECTSGTSAATPAISLSAGQYIEDVRLVGTGTQVITGTGTFGFLTRWLPDGGTNPTMSFDTGSGGATNFTVAKRLTVQGNGDASRIRFEGLGGVAVVNAHTASFNDVDVTSIAMTGASAPCMVCGGENLGGATGFAFPPAALVPLFAAGLA